MTNERNDTRIKRNTNRWLMLAYDTVIFVICWLAFMLLHPQTRMEALQHTMYLYMATGYALFIGMRLLFGIYRMILRYGAVQPFAWLLTADAIASLALLSSNHLAERIFHAPDFSFAALAGFSASYALVSLATRIAYCYLYHLACDKSPLSRAIRFLLERVALVSFDSSTPGGTMRLMLAPKEPPRLAINELQWVVDKFAIRGEVTSITQINKGYINRTYCVETLSEQGSVHQYTLQRINTHVFHDVDTLMDNYKLVTDMLYGRLHLAGSRSGAVPTLRTTKDGRSYLRDDSGCWRMATYFDHVYSLDIAEDPEVFHQAGYAFGSFLRALRNVDVSLVKEVIPNFHNTLSRYRDLEASIARDPKNRVKDVQDEIEFVRAHKEIYGIISEALEKGEIPTRICHNDCNLNNILFDEQTHLPVAIIDLDTVMPSSPLYDFGDSMRIGTNTARDDEKDLTKVSCSLHMYEQYARGYLKACGTMLTRRELELLPYAAMIITVEDGIRFLMDHIDGDIYYNISYPGQNLDRARTQLKLMDDMAQKLPQIKQILRTIYADMALMAEL